MASLRQRGTCTVTNEPRRPLSAAPNEETTPYAPLNRGCFLHSARSRSYTPWFQPRHSWDAIEQYLSILEPTKQAKTKYSDLLKVRECFVAFLFYNGDEFNSTTIESSSSQTWRKVPGTRWPWDSELVWLRSDQRCCPQASGLMMCTSTGTDQKFVVGPITQSWISFEKKTNIPEENTERVTHKLDCALHIRYDLLNKCGCSGFRLQGQLFVWSEHTARILDPSEHFGQTHWNGKR